MSSNGTVLWAALCHLGLIAGCSAAPEELDSSDLDQTSQALTNSETLVAFRTVDGSHFLTAEHDGGDTISADRTAMKAWEYFIISDLDGGSLLSGDRIQIRHVSANGESFWLTADVNGGGAGSILRANRSVPKGWETFVISRSAGGKVTSGSRITLRAATRPAYVSAERGGGLEGDGAVTVNRSVARDWETFTLLIVTPNDLCPYTAPTLCMFEKANFGGAEFNVRAIYPEKGTCADLSDHGVQARSAANANSRTATIFPNADCTGHGFGINGLEATLPFVPNSVYVY